MSIYRLQITAGPTSGAAVHADLSTPDVGVLGDSFSLGSAEAAFDASGFPLERSREVSMDVRIQKGADVGRVMQQVARAISVPDRWLLLQRTHNSDPVWYKIHPLSPGALNMHTAWTGAKGGDSKHGFWTWAVTLLTDSTAVGERRAVVPEGATSATTTVTNTGTSRGVVVDAPGEAPTPLRVSAMPSEAVNGARVLVNTFSVPWDSPLVADGEPSVIMEDTEFGDWGVGTTRSTGLSFCSGGTAITADLTDTFRRSWLGGSPEMGLLEPGRYMVMARIYRQGAGGQLRVRLAQRWGGTNSWQEWRDWRPTDGGDRTSWLVIGYVDHPYGHDGRGLQPDEIMPPYIHIQRETSVTHASAQVHLDQVAFVPVDLARGTNESNAFFAFEPGIGASGPQGISWRFDSEHRSTHAVDSAGRVHSTPAPLRTGGWAVATPGMATGVSIFLDCSDAPGDVDSIARTTDLTIEASPRMLHVGRER